ncbi:transcription elongation factor GreA [Brevibacterium album]|uniref:transcription elongation factor GreA n=1 Tax=Brevibacterium album TaxID=417948 RepID=UPI000418C238|nr:transcription elongation factor GreA [Brevibacterium album]
MTEEVTGEETWLSQEAFDRLSEELEHLSGQGRAEIAEKIDAAREEGDLKENGGYHAAREEQGKIEARIRQLEHLLRHATVGGASTDFSTASPGTVITAKVASREMRFLLGSREIVGSDSDIDVVSEASPLGAAVNGAKVGDSTSYEAPNGKSISVTVEKVEPFA